MAEFQYTTVPGKIGPFFAKLRSVGIPGKATVQWLKSIGFKSSNDVSLLTVAKAIGFCDQSGGPTETWKRYRGNDHKAIMADALRASYRSLFEVYPDASQRQDSELDHFFSTHSNAGQQVIGKTVSTFKNLAALADFSQRPHSGPRNVVGAPAPSVPSHDPLPRPDAVHGVQGTASSGSGGPEVHLDVQIHISPESTPEQIDQIFASMAKHLYGRKDG